MCCNQEVTTLQAEAPPSRPCHQSAITIREVAKQMAAVYADKFGYTEIATTTITDA